MNVKQTLLRRLPEPVTWRLYKWLGWEFEATPLEEATIMAAVRAPHVFSMDERKGWGNRMSWTDWETRRVNGHTTPRPRIGDELRCTLKSGGIGRFRVVDVDLCADPSDMWFATVADIGYVDKDSPPVTRFNVFGGVL